MDGDNWPYYSVARNGTLLYWTGPSTAGNDGRLVRVDRAGNVVPVDPSWLFNPGTPEVALALSPDGKRLAVKDLVRRWPSPGTQGCESDGLS